MNGAQLHLAVNHLPVVTLLIGSLMFGVAFARKNDGVRRTALVLLVLAGFGGAGAFFSGEPAEEVVEAVPAVQESVIHAHEEAAELAAIATAIVAALAAAALLVERRRTVPALLNGALLAGALVTTGVMARTAHLGGLIRHPELTASGGTEARPPLSDEK